MKKILVIRFSSIGDIVLTTPVVRCLKEQLPGSEIHYLSKSAFKAILESNPSIDKVHVIEKDVKAILPDLKKENYDFVIDLHHNLRSARVKRALHKPSASFNKLNFRKWLLVHFKINRMPELHVVDRYMKTVEKLGVRNDGKGLDYFIPVKDEVLRSDLPVTHQQGYLGFVIGAKHATKQLPLKKIISICAKIQQPIVLLGGKEDAETGNEIQKAIGDRVYNACGKYNLNQSASLIKQSVAVISHDTGLMHIAAAFHKKIISIWGNTVPAFGFTPYLPAEGSKRMEVLDLSCRPCSKIGYDKCPKGHFKCMQDQNEDAITEGL